MTLLKGHEQRGHGLTSFRQRPGRSMGGFPIGILVIEQPWALIPGNVANGWSHDFPVLVELVDGVSFEHLLSRESWVTERVIEAARRLAQKEVRAIVGACGSFALYQREVVEAVTVPVFTSPMLQIPWILRSFARSEKLLVIVATKTAIVGEVFEQCGITDDDRNRLEIIEAVELPEFQRMVMDKEGFVPRRLEQELVEWIGQRDLSSFRAILLQCSDLPPFASALEAASGLPVFDQNCLVEWVARAIVPPRFGYAYPY